MGIGSLVRTLGSISGTETGEIIGRVTDCTTIGCRIASLGNGIPSVKVAGFARLIRGAAGVPDRIISGVTDLSVGPTRVCSSVEVDSADSAGGADSARVWRSSGLTIGFSVSG